MAYDWEGVRARRLQRLKTALVLSAFVSAILFAPVRHTHAKTQQELDDELLATCAQRQQIYDDFQLDKAPAADLKKITDEMGECRRATIRRTQRLLDEMNLPTKP